jgi:hypothetical protein
VFFIWNYPYEKAMLIKGKCAVYLYVRFLCYNQMDPNVGIAIAEMR